ncbi:methylthioribose-1-phosphate isomerase-like [Sycon ciliatum]|uniref:methylthioribose-1-phosphate isomerase-like n=1 Tax=Sycon ciliatum TaxID=27933 RepID=UPI0031F61636
MAQTLVPLKYERGRLEVLNQLLLPHQEEWEIVKNLEDGWQAIRQMKVRGAPAIAIVAALTLAVQLHEQRATLTSTGAVRTLVHDAWTYLCTSRPTAVNLFRAADVVRSLTDRLEASGDGDVGVMIQTIIEALEGMLEKDIQDNRAIGRWGASAILAGAAAASGNSKVAVVTHCNTGSLACAGYGTALGVVRSLHEQGRLERCYCTETRPYLQGARLTAYELVVEGMPGTLIPDSAVASLMTSRSVAGIVVGADRVAANGDTANKIGTYQLAVAARYHGVRFYVAAPLTTIDLSLSSGKDIVIEERPAQELKSIRGVAIAPDAIDCWNPAFDVTPAELITGIITEHGVFVPGELQSKVENLTRQHL